MKKKNKNTDMTVNDNINNSMLEMDEKFQKDLKKEIEETERIYLNFIKALNDLKIYVETHKIDKTVSLKLGSGVFVDTVYDMYLSITRSTQYNQE